MTIKELHYEFHLLMDTIGSNGKRSFAISEVDWLLNKAQTYILNEYIKEFEKDLKRANELSSLHVKWPKQPNLSPTSLGVNKGLNVYELRLMSLVSSYYSYTRLEGTQVVSNCDINCYGRYIDNNDLVDAKLNSFDLTDDIMFFNIGASMIQTVGNSREERSIYIYTKFPLKANSLTIEYIKQPARMNYGGYTYIDNTTTVEQQCELPNQLHAKLVDTAVMLAFNAINDQAYSLKKDIVTSQT